MRLHRLLWIILIAPLLRAQPTALEILDRITTQMNPENAQGIMRQTIETTSGDLRTLEYDVYMGNEGEKSLMRYRSPSRVRGNALLMTDYSDNIWMYNRRTNRVRKLASHAKRQRFEGSDFTYEDMGSGDSWQREYKPELKGSYRIGGQKCYELHLIPKKEDPSYSKIVCRVRTADVFPIQIDYYDLEDELLKSLYLQDIRKIEGILTPMKMVMQNHVDRSQTVMEYVEITYDVDFDASFFTERNLKR